MSEQKWTKEPWCKGDDNSPLLPCTEPRQILGQLPDGRWCVLFSGNIHFPDVIPNVDRAVACVNALAGIPDPAAFVSRVRAMEEFIKDLASSGTRFDLTPTVRSDEPGDYVEYIRRIDTSIRERAKSALTTPRRK